MFVNSTLQTLGKSLADRRTGLFTFMGFAFWQTLDVRKSRHP